MSRSKYSKVLHSPATSCCFGLSFSNEEQQCSGADVEPTIDVKETEVSGKDLASE